MPPLSSSRSDRASLVRGGGFVGGSLACPAACVPWRHHWTADGQAVTLIFFYRSTRFPLEFSRFFMIFMHVLHAVLATMMMRSFYFPQFPYSNNLSVKFFWEFYSKNANHVTFHGCVLCAILMVNFTDADGEDLINVLGRFLRSLCIHTFD